VACVMGSGIKNEIMTFSAMTGDLLRMKRIIQQDKGRTLLVVVTTP
jgi:hypothetical protein